MALIASTACLALEDNRPKPQPNYPPTIRRPDETILPSAAGVTEYPINSGTVPFSVDAIEDLNVNDVLYYRAWLATGATEVIVAERLIEPTGSATRGPILYQFGQFGASLPAGEGCYRLELIVADRAFTGDILERTLPADAGQVRVVWFINVFGVAGPTAVPMSTCPPPRPPMMM